MSKGQRAVNMPSNVRWADETWWGRFVGGRAAEECWRFYDLKTANAYRSGRGAEIVVNRVSGPRLAGKSLRREMYKVYRAEESLDLKQTEVLIAKCGDVLCINPWHAIVQDKQAAINAGLARRSRPRSRASGRSAMSSDVAWSEKSDAWLWRYFFLGAWIEFAAVNPTVMDIIRVVRRVVRYLGIELSTEEVRFLTNVQHRPGVRDPDMLDCSLSELLPFDVVLRFTLEPDMHVLDLWQRLLEKVGPGYNARDIRWLSDVVAERDAEIAEAERMMADEAGRTE